MSTNRDDIFISYSHHDKLWLDQLKTHLRPYVRAGTLNIWDDSKIKAGSNWREDIRRMLSTSRAALLLVTPHFLASDFITDHELKPIVEAAKKDGLILFWIAVESSAFEITDLNSYQALNDPNRPLNSLDDHEQNLALVEICARIGSVINAPRKLPQDLSQQLDHSISTAPSQHWIILGAGRLGRGFLTDLAQDIGFSTTMVVAGIKTPKDTVDAYNNQQRNGGYTTIALDENRTEHYRQIVNYRFVTSAHSEGILERIANSSTRIISTSVGLRYLLSLIPLMAEGITVRLRSPSDHKLLILVCENGLMWNEEPAVVFRHKLREAIHPSQRMAFDDLVEIPRIAVDCIVPTVPQTAPFAIYRGWGRVLVESTTLTRRLLANSGLVSFHSLGPDVHVHKLYAFNTVHCCFALFGVLLGEKFIHGVSKKTLLREAVQQIIESVVSAINVRYSRRSAQSEVIDRMKVNEYCAFALQRIINPPSLLTDPIDRILPKLHSGNYLDDGRLMGPLHDLGADEHPDAHRALVHAVGIAIFLRYYGRVFDDRLPSRRHCANTVLQRRFYWLDAESLVRDVLATTEFRHAECSLAQALTDDVESLHELVSRKSSTPLLTEQELSTFLSQPIVERPLAINMPPSTTLRCVISNLNETLVTTEALLFQVTREMIRQLATTSNKVFTHDEYLQFVGQDEISFFANEVIPRFQIETTDVDELVRIREEQFLNALVKTDGEMMCRPGVRTLLTVLKREGIRLAVYSNASRARMEQTLAHVGLKNYFDCVSA